MRGWQLSSPSSFKMCLICSCELGLCGHLLTKAMHRFSSVNYLSYSQLFQHKQVDLKRWLGIPAVISLIYKNGTVLKHRLDHIHACHFPQWLTACKTVVAWIQVRYPAPKHSSSFSYSGSFSWGEQRVTLCDEVRRCRVRGAVDSHSGRDSVTLDRNSAKNTERWEHYGRVLDWWLISARRAAHGPGLPCHFMADRSCSSLMCLWLSQLWRRVQYITQE